jgi:hypothetical protein
VTFDELRALKPHLGLAAYAYEPGGPVTLEVIYEGEVLGRFTAATAAEAIAKAFPALARAEPEVNIFD